jgi:hypothetical protein
MPGEDPVDVRFSSDERKVLKALKDIETGQKMINGALSVGVFKDLFTGEPEDRIYAIKDTDWDLFANAVKATKTIAACKEKEALESFFLDNNGAWPDTDGSRVLRKMFELFDTRCTG